MSSGPPDSLARSNEGKEVVGFEGKMINLSVGVWMKGYALERREM
jgi:hypothetical protein